MCSGSRLPAPTSGSIVEGPCLRLSRAGSPTFLAELLEDAILVYRPLPPPSTDLAVALIRPAATTTTTSRSSSSRWSSTLLPPEDTSGAYASSLSAAAVLGHANATFNGSFCAFEFGPKEYAAVLAANGYSGTANGLPPGNAAVFGRRDPTTRAWALYAQVFGRKATGSREDAVPVAVVQIFPPDGKSGVTTVCSAPPPSPPPPPPQRSPPPPAGE
jgi:hypothetical protein